MNKNKKNKQDKPKEIDVSKILDEMEMSRMNREIYSTERSARTRMESPDPMENDFD